MKKECQTLPEHWWYDSSSKKYICPTCYKDHRYKKSNIKNNILFIGMFGGFTTGILLFVKISYCVLLQDNSCWSHFP